MPCFRLSLFLSVYSTVAIGLYAVAVEPMPPAGTQHAADDSESVRFTEGTAKLQERTIQFAAEGRHDLALILLHRLLIEERIFANPPETRYEELMARKRMLQPSMDAIGKSISSQAPDDRAAWQAGYEKRLEKRFAERGEKSVADIRRDVAGWSSMLCARGEKITFEEGVADVKRGAYLEGHHKLFPLTVLGTQAVVPRESLDKWLSAAEAGVRDAAAGEAAVQRITQASEEDDLPE